MKSEIDYKKINQKYLNDPDECPFCGSIDITASNGDFGYKTAFRDVQCNDCGKIWTEEFKLTGITPF
jgi:transcription elongation factor Elf1